MDKIILIGAGGHARSCIDVIELSNQFKISGLVEKNKSKSEENFGYPMIGADKDLQDIRRDYEFALITIGQIKSAETRVRLFRVLTDLDYKLPVIVSSRSHLSKSSVIGPGTIIMHDVLINTNAKIGKNCIINNKALIEHDAAVGDHCHIATGAIVNGGVTIGSESFIGSGAIMKQSISIGRNCVIGAGAVIKTNVESNQVIKG